MLSTSASDLGIRIPLHFVVILLLGKLSAYANLSYVSTFLSLSFLHSDCGSLQLFLFHFCCVLVFHGWTDWVGFQIFRRAKENFEKSHLGSTWWPSVLRWVFSMSLSSRISLASSVSTWVSAAQQTYPVRLAHWVDQRCLCFTLCAPCIVGLLCEYRYRYRCRYRYCFFVIRLYFFLLTPKLLAILLAHGLP